jgi:hypothetical protein
MILTNLLICQVLPSGYTDIFAEPRSIAWHGEGTLFGREDMLIISSQTKMLAMRQTHGSARASV